MATQNEKTETNNEFLEFNPSKLENDILCFTEHDKSSVKCDNKRKPDIRDLPKSSVLSRVKDFLPQISKANIDLQNDLSKGITDKYDIENVNNEDRIIEIDLSLVPTSDTEGKNIPAPILDLLNSNLYDSDSSSDESSDEGENDEDHINDEKKLISEV
ncbi:uncharacterized protein LOC120327986 [Styela clava]|uniref:uncharacterized protein C12orf45-like n=1 Tax=Styela clava TaxID=7725 RepID=UPI00193A4B1D|nr:uncharacterized protein C12orf45-like [Styela clava]